MHRLILALSLLWAGCGAQRVEVRDPARVERLRLQITKARNAIEETRAAIAKARGAAYLPELYVRLAELLGEEARYHYQVAYEREQRSVKALHVPQVRFLKEQAIALYRQVLKRYPETALADRVLFNLGQEHRELGQYDAMRAALQRLVDEHATSALRNDALLVLPGQVATRSLVYGDRTVVDGAFTGLARGVVGLGAALRLLQNGLVRSYAAIMLAGVVVLVAVVLAFGI